MHLSPLLNSNIPDIVSQAKFTEFIHQGVDRAEAYQSAGYKPKTRLLAQQAASRLLTTNTKVVEYLECLKANDDRNTNISRTMQLNKLNQAFNIAIEQKNPSAMVSAIREQNEMLGYHRESAPNPEREKARRKLSETEIIEIQRIVRIRTAELAQTKPEVKEEEKETPFLGQGVGVGNGGGV